MWVQRCGCSCCIVLLWLVFLLLLFSFDAVFDTPSTPASDTFRHRIHQNVERNQEVSRNNAMVCPRGPGVMHGGGQEEVWGLVEAQP